MIYTYLKIKLKTGSRWWRSEIEIFVMYKNDEFQYMDAYDIILDSDKFIAPEILKYSRSLSYPPTIDSDDSVFILSRSRGGRPSLRVVPNHFYTTAMKEDLRSVNYRGEEYNLYVR